MKDTNREDTRNRQKKRTERDVPDTSADTPMESYTPAQRRMIRKGLHILVKVAVRAHMRRRAEPPKSGDNGGEGQCGD